MDASEISIIYKLWVRKMWWNKNRNSHIEHRKIVALFRLANIYGNRLLGRANKDNMNHWIFGTEKIKGFRSFIICTIRIIFTIILLL